MHPANDPDKLHVLLVDRIDDVDAAAPALDGHVQALTVLVNRDIVGPTAEGNRVRYLEGLRVDDIEHLGRLVAEIEPTPVGRGRHPVNGLDPGDLADDRVRCRVDQLNVVARGIRLHDDGPELCGDRRAQERPGGDETDG